MDRRDVLLRGALMALAVTASISGCVVTESGNPPVIDRESVSPVGALGDQFVLTSRGAITPGGGQVLLANLTRPGFTVVPVEPNGDFSVQVPYMLDDSFRLQAIGSDGLFSAPYDFRTTTGDDQIALETSSLDCLTRSFLIGQLRLTNNCSAALSLQIRGSHVSVQADPAEVELAAGASGTVQLVLPEGRTVITIDAGDTTVALTVR